jgi:hypothetical protein
MLGPKRLRELEADLRTLTGGRNLRLDVPGWFEHWDVEAVRTAAS